MVYELEKKIKKVRSFKNLKTWVKIVICIMGLMIIVAFIWKKSFVGNQDNGFSIKYVNSKEIPSMLQFTYYEKEEWKEKLKGKFSEKLTYGDVESILDILNMKEYISYKAGKSYQKINRTNWNLIYEQIVDILDTDKEVEKKSLLVLKTEKDTDISTIVTQDGKYLLDSCLPALEQYEGYEVYCKGDIIFGIDKVSENEILIDNTFVTNSSENEIDFIFQNENYHMPIVSSETISNTVCDIYLIHKEIEKVKKKVDTIDGKLITLADNKIEIEGYGVIERSKRLPVYQTYGTIEEKDLKDIVIGNMDISYVVADKCVCAIVLNQPAVIENVRVLLLSDDQTEYRADITVSSDMPYTITCGEQTETKAENEIVTASNYLKDVEDTTLKIQPNEGGTIKFVGADGTKSTVGYEGTLEIRRYDEGYVVVNVLSVEKYLYGVISSEMSSSFESEALKAQAVCARSYVYMQLLKGDYAQFGAHIDDSTNYQVYNKQAHSEQTTKAVDDTCGQILTYQGNVIETYYFSTSYGHTGNYDAWGLDGEEYGYLQGKWLKEDATDIDLSDENTFAAYIQNADDDCYDSGAKFFRWKATLNFTEVADELTTRIQSRKEAASDKINFLSVDGTTSLDSMEDFGDLQTITVEQRNSSGVILKLLLTFKKGEVEISSEYNMRMILGCAIQNMVCNDGSEASDMSILPSAYFMITPVEDNNFVVYGGGYGHGIGMSQNGANGMAQKGYTYDQILKYFYQDVTIDDNYTKNE